MNLPIQLEELKNRKVWVNYVLLWKADKNRMTKPPVNPYTLKNGSSTKESSWSTFDEAVAQIGKTASVYDFDTKESHSLPVAGVGIILEAAGLLGFDFDHIIDKENSTFKASAKEAKEIILQLDSYTEFSPSGDGIHVLAKATSPVKELNANGKTKGVKIKLDDSIEYEMYDNGRYFTVTGNALPNCKGLEDRQSVVESVYKQYYEPRMKKAEDTSILGASSSESPKTSPNTLSVASTASDIELWAKIFEGRYGDGAKAKRLYEGNYESDFISTHSNGVSYPDHSAADLALCNYLALATNLDAERVDRMFRQSGLYREKWDRKDYRDNTIAVAFSGKNRREERQIFDPEVDFGVGQVLTSEPVENTLVDPIKEQVDSISSKAHCVSDYIDKYLEKEIEAFSAYRSDRTGFSNIDAITGFYPALYALGAVSSLGKTTFANELADNLAQMGRDVIYFSLEQNMLEIVTKSISRESYLIGGEAEAKSAIDIRRGTRNPTVVEATRKYKELSKTITVVECNFHTDVDTMIAYVSDYMEKTKSKPVVIIDYLQIVPPPEDSRKIRSTKDSIDYTVRALKTFQVDNELVVIMISSLNRQNYLQPIDFESFKESGGIEYSCDVIWGLQLQVMNDEIFSKDGRIKEKRELVKKAKHEIPRKIELVCLKNRNGIANYSVGFEYFPQFDYFKVDDRYKADWSAASDFKALKTI